jgi:amidohydrolase
MTLSEKVKQLALAVNTDVLTIRRHLHQHPELSFQEKETSEYIISWLKKHNIKHTTGWVDTGIVALIEGKNPTKKTIALRADIDALPIEEKNKVPYASKNKGVMHACGHDAHSASLLGAAFILNQLKEEFEGTIKLIFQPGEEKLPGGASLLIKEGVLKNPDVELIIGQHVLPSMAAGKVGFKKGMFMASSDEIYVTVNGKGGHGAMPHLGIDPVLISAHIIVALQQIVSRRSNPLIPSVLTFGKVEAKGATNVIPNEVKLEGTFRTFDEKWRKEAHVIMKEMAETIAKSMGGCCDFKIDVGYPFLKNDDSLTEKCAVWATEYLGEKNVEQLEMRMTAEDFAYYAQEVPASFYRLGTGNIEKNITSGLHTPTFNIDEDALPVGSGLMAWLAVNALG